VARGCRNGASQQRSLGYSSSLFLAITVFVVVNALVYWKRAIPCFDLIYPSGIPFALLEEGGEVEIRRVLWGGVLEDIGVILATALIAKRIATHRNNG
jgi:hypothetical protein